MESIFSRYRNLVVLLAVLVAQMVGLAMQVRRNAAGRNTLNPQDASGVRLIRLWANAIVSPPEQAIHYTANSVVWVWQNYFYLRGVRKQNRELQQTVGRLRLEQAELLEDARQGQRLQAMLGFQEQYIYKTVPAQVYGSSGSVGSHVFYIDKGSDNGLKRDMAVITADGVVGKVRDVFPHSAQVLAVNDQTSGAGVILETTRVRGILRGNASGQLEVVGILADERIKPGEKVLTAGGDLIFPRGLPAGEVEKVVSDPERDGFIDVLLKPAAKLDQLDEVLVITSMQSRFSDQEKQDISTSQQLEGAEAAAIEAQRKAAAITAERLPTLIEPDLPPEKQPINDSTPPVPMGPPPQPLHPDRFSPIANQGADSGQAAGGTQKDQPAAAPAVKKPAAKAPAASKAPDAASTAQKSIEPETARRQP
ncbi:MAG TPA: rod shape-determining protein MreC [Terracidiphilus sp.]|nr:rod shape-determining protein MreC [Terracidiphilus sp.]